MSSDPRSGPLADDDPLPPSTRAIPARPEPRDTDATAFTTILETLLEHVPGADAAALVDSQGETVDYAGGGDPFDLRVAAAHLQLILGGIRRFGALGEPQWLVVRGTKRSLAATALPDGYVLTLLVRARTAFAISTRAVRACIRALAEEAGWSLSSTDKRAWYPVHVETDKRGRPISLRTNAESVATPVEVLGLLTGLAVREKGFRVRTAHGAELTLVREAKNRWYADEAAADSGPVRSAHEKR